MDADKSYARDHSSTCNLPLASPPAPDLPVITSFGIASAMASDAGPPIRAQSTSVRGKPAPSTAAKSLTDVSLTTFGSTEDNLFDPSELRTPEALRATERARCFLLLNLVFTYGLNPQIFCGYMADASPESFEPDIADCNYLSVLGQCLRAAYTRVRQNQFSLLVSHDRLRIIKDVLIPARNLNIKPEYLCEHLMWYTAHNFDNAKRYNTYLFSKSTRGIFKSTRKWETKEALTHLAECLVSDDCVVSEIAPNEQLQVFLGRFIADFNVKHRRKGIDMGTVSREIHVREHTRRLLQTVDFYEYIRGAPSQTEPGSTYLQSQQSLVESQQDPFKDPSYILIEEDEGNADD
ncbi:hypothetical protein OPT61_g2442 [Boeremia exigua]|uniref:Uncharacterized protein n=1 Tax=Boeremia exigua TaxID=749465 RepID=A0ACC2ILQ8_9PLEO|nr:hypothetical protein OPT61_g2442 [Boeremia exigua]